MTIERAYDVVELVLKTDKETRNCDTELVFAVWKVQTGKSIYSRDDSKYLLAPESITRARRVIQNDQGRYLPTRVGVLVQRRIKEESIKKYFSKEKKFLQNYLDLKYGVS